MLHSIPYSLSPIIKKKRDFQLIFMKQDGAISGGEKRDYVIQELVETERNYSDVLNSLLKHFADLFPQYCYLKIPHVFFLV